jgi:hypothetical protein
MEAENDDQDWSMEKQNLLRRTISSKEKVQERDEVDLANHQGPDLHCTSLSTEPLRLHQNPT